MSIDLVPLNPSVTPATPEVSYPLIYMRKMLTEARQDGNQIKVRLYSEHVPYRRIVGPVVLTPAQAVVDADGNPVLDESGMPQMTEPVVGEGIVGEQLQPEREFGLTDGEKVIVIEADNILDYTQTDAAGEALVGQAIAQFVATGGNINALAFAATLLSVKSIGIRQGKLVP